MKTIIFMAVLIGIVSSECLLGVDMSTSVTTSTFQCMIQNDYHYAIVRAYRSFGGMDNNAVQTLQNARSLGMYTDIYMFPCRGKDPIQQVDELMDNIPSYLYNIIWVDV